MPIPEIITGVSILSGGIAGFVKLRSRVNELILGMQNNESAHIRLRDKLEVMSKQLIRANVNLTSVLVKQETLDLRVTRLENKVDRIVERSRA